MSSSTWEGLEKWLSGYAISLIMTPIPIVYKEPLSYNYNGTKLPPFSHYDKNFYPYICLYKDETCKSTYVAYATTLPFMVGEEKNTIAINPNSETIVSKIVTLKENKWSQFNPVASYGVKEFSPLWQNIEIKNAKNEILFQTYKPIPVYSQEVEVK